MYSIYKRTIMIQKRFQYRTNKGIQWTDWLPYVKDNTKLSSIQKEEKWQLKPNLRNEFRIV